MKEPEPVNKHVVCSVCGLDWDRHEYKPTSKRTIEKCVELLKKDLAEAQASLAKRPFAQWATAANGAVYCAR